MTLRSRELSPLALRQLGAWRAYASKWHWHLELRRTDKGHRLPDIEQYHICCAPCGNSIAVLMSEGTGYLLNTERILDEVTRHLRNNHRGLEGEIYGRYGIENSAASPDTRGPGPDNGSSANPSGLQAEK